MKRFGSLTKYADLYAKLYLYNEKIKERDRKEFLNLLLDDEVVKNNRTLQEKYMELYDKYIGR